jgi:hypothetical protein
MGPGEAPDITNNLGLGPLRSSGTVTFDDPQEAVHRIERKAVKAQSLWNSWRKEGVTKGRSRMGREGSLSPDSGFSTVLAINSV